MTKEKLIDKIETAEDIRSIILNYTAILKGARNPTRDATVILGEKLCDLIDMYIVELCKVKEDK